MLTPGGHATTQKIRQTSGNNSKRSEARQKDEVSATGQIVRWASFFLSYNLFLLIYFADMYAKHVCLL